MGDHEDQEDDSPAGEVRETDVRMAEEIAQFVADRAFLFDDHECRAWALTDFQVWASLAGREARLRLDDE